jgi:predicted metal-dependent hydrolase
VPDPTPLPTTPGALRRGAALFDEGQFWEAHEAWEEAWLEEEGEVRLFLQGLIQVAAGYHKATVQMQPNGCVKLLRSGLDKLDPLPPELLGVALARFRPEVERTLAEARRWQSGELPAFPRQLIPRLALGA